MKVAIPGPGLLEFWWKLSALPDLDCLCFSLGGVEHARLEAEVGWQQRFFHVAPGVSEAEWTYARHSYQEYGEDAAWLDQVRFHEPGSIQFPQTITFDPGEGPLTRPAALNGSVYSGLPVSYEIEGPALLVSNWLVPNGHGTVRITASQEGSDFFLPAQPVERSLLVSGERPVPLAANAPEMSVTVGGFSLYSVKAVAVQNDGKVIIGGHFRQAGGKPRVNLARFNPDGTLDQNWRPSTDGRVTGLAVQENHLFINGGFSQVNGVSRPGIAKIALNDEGSVDELWNPAPDAIVHAMALSEDGLIVGGQFSRIGAKEQRFLAKLSTEGAGQADPVWDPKPSGAVGLMAVHGPNLYYPISEQGTQRLVKASTRGQGEVVSNWKAPLFGRFERLSATELSLYAVGSIGGESPGTSVGLAQFSAEDGRLLTTLHDGRHVRNFGVSESHVYVMDDFWGEGMHVLERFGRETLQKEPGWTPSIHPMIRAELSVPGEIAQILPHGSDLYVVGDFRSLAFSGSGIALIPGLDAAPIVTAATTSVGMTSTAGLNIIPHPRDLIEVTHYKISHFAPARLFKADGTPLIEDQIITRAEGAAGLRFEPPPDFFGTAGFMVRSIMHETEGPAGRGEVTVLEHRLSQFIKSGLLRDTPFDAGSVFLEYSASSGLPVEFAVDSGPGRVEGSSLIFTGIGEIRLVAWQPGNEIYAPSHKIFQILAVLKASQTISFEPVVEARVNEVVQLGASASSRLPVMLELVSGPAVLSGQLLTITNVGRVVLRASQPGDANYLEAEPVEQVITVGKAFQTIEVAPLVPVPWNGGSVRLKASASSGLLVRFSLVSGRALLEDGGLTALGAGPVVIEAIQEGSELYAPARVEHTVIFSKAAQTIRVEPFAPLSWENPAVELRASASSGLPVAFNISGPAVLASNVVTVTAPGHVTVTAQQPGNDDYEPSPAFIHTFELPKRTQVIALEPMPAFPFHLGRAILAESASSGLPIEYEILTGPAAVSSNIVSFSATGVVTLRASQPGNEVFLSAPPVEQSFEITKGDQAIDFEPLQGQPMALLVMTLKAWASSGLPVSFLLESGPATLGSNQLELHAGGEVSVRAIQAGNENYHPAPDVLRTFSVAKAVQAITFAEIPDRSWNEGPITLSAPASSLLPVEFSIVSGPATVSSNQLWLHAAGRVAVLAIQRGNNVFEAAEASQSFQSRRAGQSIAFEAPETVPFSAEPFVLNGRASSGLAVTYDVMVGEGSVEGNLLYVVQAGPLTVRALQPGDELWEPAEPVQRTLQVLARPQSIDWPQPEPARLHSGPVQLAASASSGLPVRYGILSGKATLSGDLLTPLGLGVVSLLAMQPGNFNYLAADSVERQITILKALQTIHFPARDPVPVESGPFELTAATSSGLPVRFAVLSGPAWISDNILTPIEAGAVTIVAEQRGNEEYEAAPPVEQTIHLVAGSGRPFLEIQVEGTSLALSWPLAYQAYQLEETSTLELQDSWTPVEENRAEIGDIFSVTISITSGTGKFYRLQSR